MRMLPRWFLTLVCLGLVVGAAAVAALLAWPSVGVAASPSGLAGISLPGYSGHVERVSVTGKLGKPFSRSRGRRFGSWEPLDRLASLHMWVSELCKEDGFSAAVRGYNQ